MGNLWGNESFWPEISPNKTVEGFIGGIVTAVVLSLVFQAVTGFLPSYLLVMFITLLLSIFGQLGDLVESAFKASLSREGFRDNSPGHGGILDRFDSFLFVLPFFYTYCSQRLPANLIETY
ncbi:hypothetical protein BsIDN1_30230 [Bacillus safensis]|uniref:Phosphatidate cytidylyltransferase n=1 Tax=Bacillus safensis TaxID=561879 RepID=A0A5S9M975_BACIA|nr:hypothetical protein BsIDN1_30230 [Bacillus safensis]